MGNFLRPSINRGRMWDEDDYMLESNYNVFDIARRRDNILEHDQSLVLHESARITHPSKVFVYGSLKRGQIRHKVLEEYKSIYQGEGVLYSYRMMKQMSFPAIYWDPAATNPIKGEVWSCTLECMDALDIIEGVKTRLFSRRAMIIPGFGLCLVYVQDKPVHVTEVDIVHSGIWLGPDTVTEKLKIGEHVWGSCPPPYTPYNPPPYVAPPPPDYGSNVGDLIWQKPKSALPAGFVFPQDSLPQLLEDYD